MHDPQANPSNTPASGLFSFLKSSPAIDIRVDSKINPEAPPQLTLLNEIPISSVSDFEHAILFVADAQISVLKKSPYRAEGLVTGGWTSFLVSLDDEDEMRSRKPFTINGQEMNAPFIAYGTSGAWWKMVDSVETRCALFAFRTDMSARGWPNTGELATSLAASAPLIGRLQSLTADIFRFASISPALMLSQEWQRAMRNNLLSLLDEILFDSQTTPGGISEFQASIARRVDEYIADNFSRPIYDDDVAREVGVSSRTLNTIIKRTSGMSLHRYLREYRMWQVRMKLLHARRPASVKTIALDCGFWHLGRFSVEYRQRFGESPSATLDANIRD